VGRIRSYEFTNSAQVKEMTLEEPRIQEKTASAHLDALRAARHERVRPEQQNGYADSDTLGRLSAYPEMARYCLSDTMAAVTLTAKDVNLRTSLVCPPARWATL
jgi:hypothetical protein